MEELGGVSPYDAFRALRRLKMPFILSGICNSGQRFTFAGADPFITLRSSGAVTEIEGCGLKSSENADPFDVSARILRDFRYDGKGPFPFTSGAFGYFSYDLKDVIEPRAVFKRGKGGGIGLPGCVLGFYDPIFVFDHERRRASLISAKGDRDRFKEMKGLIKNAPAGVKFEVPAATGLRSDTSKDGFMEAVVRAKEYISSGDIYQINLSHRLTFSWNGDPLALFLRLTETHPAPFSSFMDLGPFQVISNSPERLIRIKDGVAETSPIKGTRRRGSTPEEDRRLIEELRTSRKERAEHVMIVDLERNDLGRISVAGSVHVPAFEEIESYPHLHHMISTVRSRLMPGMDAPLALRAIFPGGSITGAPKIRAMEIIDELEASPRGIYTGGIGWMDFNGDMDIAMAIRTAVYSGGSLHLSLGGGIVADSDPEDEYRETILKAEDFMDALGVDANGL